MKRNFKLLSFFESRKVKKLKMKMELANTEKESLLAEKEIYETYIRAVKRKKSAL